MNKAQIEKELNEINARLEEIEDLYEHQDEFGRLSARADKLEAMIND